MRRSCRRCRSGRSISAWPAKKKCWASLLRGIRWRNMRTSCRIFALTASQITEMTSGTGRDEITTAGVISAVRVMKSRKGDLYANAVMEDMTGTVEAIVFPEAYKRLQNILKQEIPM